MDQIQVAGLTIRQLRAFCAAARLLSYTRAASELGCHQPTISALIAHVEQTTQLTLFEQQGKRVILTDEGRELYAHAQEIVESADELQMIAARMRGAMEAGATRLRLVADTTVGTYILPRVVKAFRLRRPDITVNLEVTNRAGVRTRLLEHAVDLVIAGRPPAVDGLAVEPFMRNELVVVVAPSHPLVDKGTIPLKDLARESFLLREEGAGTRAAIEELFEVAGLPLTIGMTLGHIESLKRAVAAGLGVSVFSRGAVRREVRWGELVILPVEGFPLERHWFMARLAAHPPTANVAAFLEFLRVYRDQAEEE